MACTLGAAMVMAAGCGGYDANPSNSGGSGGQAGDAGTTSSSGATSSGGSATGGDATGGNATGGSATGGSATGGSATGGSATGGSDGGATTAGSGGSGGGTAGDGASGTAAGSVSTSGSGGNAGTGGGGVCPVGAAGAGGNSGLVPTADDDGDGVANCLDQCPHDASRTTPGACGCGSVGSEDDTDLDGTSDCNDECPNDASKIAAGVCGCGISDSANADGDAVIDCKDACPKDPLLTEPGVCGCLPATLGALCLAHRYKFDGTGVVATDSIAGPSGNGTVVGAQLSGTGTVVLLGADSDQYVNLPAALISAVGDSATFEAWVTWTTASDWQRVFDFGNSTAGAGLRGAAAGSVFLTPRAGGSGLRAAISPSDYNQEDVAGIDTPMPASAITHVVVVVDGVNKKLSLYRDGAGQGAGATIRPESRLSMLKDVNNWIGRSQYAPDPGFSGTIHDFRIYSRVLTAGEINASFAAGADAP